MSLFDKLQRLFGITIETIHLSEQDIQRRAAPVLRQAAINHLRTDKNGLVAPWFRGEYIAAAGLEQSKTHQQFLNKQEQDGQWATYIEAAALGELLECNVTVNDGNSTYCLYRAEKDDAPTVHLKNSGNVHWSVNNKTLGFGNCLYNAFAQALQKLVKKELGIPFSRKASPAEVLVNKSIYAPEPDHNPVIQHQKEIEQATGKQPRPSELKQALEDEQIRIGGLPKEQQQQIQEDYELALKLAEGEWLNSIRANNSYFKTPCAHDALADNSLYPPSPLTSVF